MTFGTESCLEQYWRGLIKERLSGEQRFAVLDDKGIADMVICRDGNPPIAFFLEFKINIPSIPSKRMSIGAGKGKGIQVEVLRKKLLYFERYLRWILCNDIENGERYIIATNETIRNNVRRGLGNVGEKQNNIDPKIFSREKLLTENELLDALREYLQTN